MSELLPELGPLGDNERDITARIGWFDDGRVSFVGINGRDAHTALITRSTGGFAGSDDIKYPGRFGLTPPERTFDVVVKLTEGQVRERARLPDVNRDHPNYRAGAALNLACKALISGLDGEVQS